MTRTNFIVISLQHKRKTVRFAVRFCTNIISTFKRIKNELFIMTKKKYINHLISKYNSSYEDINRLIALDIDCSFERLDDHDWTDFPNNTLTPIALKERLELDKIRLSMLSNINHEMFDFGIDITRKWLNERISYITNYLLKYE